MSGEVIPEPESRLDRVTGREDGTVVLHRGILEIGLRVALLGVNEDGEFGGVTEEEDGRIVEDPIPVALLGIEFHGESAGISGRVGGTLLATNGGESSDTFGLLSNAIEHVNRCLEFMLANEVESSAG